MSFRRRALFLAGLFVAVSCSDAGNPVGPPVDPIPRPGPGEGIALDCSLHVATGTLNCGTPGANTGAALGAGSIIVGGQNKKVRLVASNHVFRKGNLDAVDSLEIDVTVKNLMHQALGTEDGSTVAPSGVQLFFAEEPYGFPTGSVSVENASTGMFTSGTSQYFQYNQVLRPDSVSAPQKWIFKYDSAATNIRFGILVKAAVQYPGGFVKVTPRADTLAVNETLALNAVVYNAVSDTLPVSPTWSSNDPAVATVDANTGLVTAVGFGTAVITATHGSKTGTATIVVNDAPVLTADTTAAVSNVTVPRPAGRLLARATDAQALSVVADSINTAQNGVVIANADGSFTYLSAPGFSGEDSFQFRVTDGVSTTTGTMVVNVAASNYWYVRAGPAAVTADGRDRRPFGSIAAAQAVAGDADSIFVLASGASLEGAAVLKNQQGLIGAGITSPIFFKMSALDSVAVMTPGAMPGLTHTAGTTVTVAQNNVVAGVSIDNAGGTAIGGSGFGTLRIRQVSAEPSGRALDLSTGTVDAVFLTLSSVGTTGGIVLNAVDGSMTVGGSGRISVTGAGGPAVSITGGSVNVNYPGSVVQRTANPLVAVSNHTGNLTFGGVLADSAGTGLQFNNAGGIYTFADSVTLAGGDAGLDVLGSSGEFSFPTYAAIVNPSTGPAVNVFGGSPALFYRGVITHNTGRAVVVNGITADSVVLRAAITSGTAASPTGLGILVQNVSGGAVVLDSVKSIYSGAAPAVTLSGNTGGAIRFAGGMDLTTTAGAGFAASGAGTVSVTGMNTVATGTGIPVTLTGVNTGAAGVSFTGVNTSAGAPNGIVLSGISGAGFQATSGTVSATTGPAVQLTNTSAADSVSLRGMTLSRSAGAGAVISGTNFGKLHVLNTSATAAGGPGALVLATGTLSGAFSTLSSNASTGSGVSLTAVNGAIDVNAGSINTAGAAAFLLSGGNVGGTIAATVAQASAQPLLSVLGGHSGSLTFAGNLTAINGTGLQFTDADGTYNLTGSLSLAGGDAGIDIAAGSTGTVDVNPAGANTAAITSPSGVAISIVGGSADLTYRGNVTQASNVSLLSVTSGHSGDVAFPVGTLSATNGNGLQFDNADGTYVFGGSVTLAGGDAGIDVTNGSGGTFTFPATANIVSPSTGNLVSILNSAPTFTYSGAFTKANNNVTGILVSNNTGGSVTFNGSGVTKSISSGTAAAVNLANNGGATINFAGGSLSITSGSGAGFTATGGGTVNVTGANNTVASTAGGTAVNIANTTIGGSGVNLFSVNASGGGTNGIVLANTGAGGFQVTGDGASDPNNTTRGRTTAKSGGGTVVLGSGGTITGRSGHGVSLATTGPVILRNMLIQGSGSSGDGINAATVARLTVDNTRITGHASDHGILGNGVSGFALHHSEVDNNGTTVGVVEGPDIWNIRLLGLTGTDTIRNSNIHRSQENVLGIINTSGVLDLTVLNTNITDTGTGAGGTSAFMVAANGSSNVTLNMQNDSINRGRSRGLQIGTEAGSSAVLNLTVNNSQFHQNGAAIDVSHGSGGTNTFSITNNNLQAGAGSLQAIIVNRAGSPSFNSFGLFTGTVSGNIIGTAGTPNSGSDTSNGIEVESNGSGGIMRVAVVNNTVREVGLHGIYVAAVDANIGGTAPPLLEARVASNTISNLEAVALDGIHVLPGALNTDDLTMCIDIANNTSTGIRNGLRVRPSGLPAAPSTVQLEGWDGVTAVNTYFTSRPNTLVGGTAPVSTTAPPAPGGFSAVANCNTP
jgi:hypothetical protein